MLYEKVILEENEARNLYKEDLLLGDDGRIVFRKRRRFQEFLGASAFGDDSRVIAKGVWVKLGLELPNYIPVREPAENWFQVAMRHQEPDCDPLGLEARYKGFLPVHLVFDQQKLFQERTGMIVVEDNPDDFELVDYALFIYDRANYSSFIDEVEKLLEKSLRTHFGRAVRDVEGNTIMVSDSVTDQAMMLMPLALIDKDAIQKAWRATLASEGR